MIVQRKKRERVLLTVLVLEGDRRVVVISEKTSVCIARLEVTGYVCRRKLEEGTTDVLDWVVVVVRRGGAGCAICQGGEVDRSESGIERIGVRSERVTALTFEGKVVSGEPIGTESVFGLLHVERKHRLSTSMAVGGELREGG